MPFAWIGPPEDPYVKVLHALGEELDGLQLPEGPARWRLEYPGSTVLDTIRGQIETSVAKVVARRWACSYVVQASAPWSTGIGSTLYALGAPHATWRRWFALAAAAERLVGNWCSAVLLGAIAGEWQFVDAIDDTRETMDGSSSAIWHLLGKRPRADVTALEASDPSWAALVTAAEAGDAARVGFALQRIIDEAMADDRWVEGETVRTGDPGGEHFLPFAWAPYTEAGTAAAAAAVLRRRGLAPSHKLGQARLRLIEPGLAEGDSWLGAQRFLP